MGKVPIKCKVSVSSHFLAHKSDRCQAKHLALIFTLSPPINKSTHRHLENDIQFCSVSFVVQISMNAFTKEVWKDIFSKRGQLSEFDAKTLI